MTLLRRDSVSGFRPLVTLAIVALWVVLMGALLRDRYMPAVSSIAEGIHLAAAESDDWFIIRIGGAYSGFGRSRQYRQDNRWRLRDDLNISLNIQGQVKPIKIVNESDVDNEFKLISFHLKVASGLISFEQKGRMDGSKLVLDVPKSQGGGVRTMRLYETPRISRSLGLPVPLSGLETGQEIRLPIFDPMDGQKWDAVIRVAERADIDIAGKKVAAWRVRATFRTVELVMWIDDEGKLLKGRMPMGITVIRSSREEIAKELKGVRDMPDLMSLTTVPVDGNIPEGADLQLLKLKVQGDADWPIPSDDFRQKFVDSELTVTSEQLPEGTYSLPCTDPKMEIDLTPSRFIQSDNAAIVKQAKEIVGEEKNPVKAARLINSWVYKNLRKVPTPSVPDAYTVLQTKHGDCNEHAILAAAFARAVGLPARVAVGLVRYGDGFCYHAWVAYWAGTKWFTGDPLMNQFPAGATHVTLLYGDVDKHVNVISFLGRLRLKVLETKPASSGSS